MKQRASLVSNSSSSSFVVYDWSLLDDPTRDKILNPYQYIIALWKSKGYDFFCDDKTQDAHLIDNVGCDEDFGYVGDWWPSKYNVENDSIEFSTSMDNFDMIKWVKYIGGINFKDLGENFGYFSDESTSLPEELPSFFEILKARKAEQ